MLPIIGNFMSGKLRGERARERRRDRRQEENKSTGRVGDRQWRRTGQQEEWGTDDGGGQANRKSGVGGDGKDAREDSHDLKNKGTERSISHVTHM